MKTFDVQGIEIRVPCSEALAFIADPTHLPKWTHAFSSVSEGRALLRTPNGEVGIGLEVHVSAQEGTVDWEMAFPDGSVATAYSRLVAVGRDRSIYSFVPRRTVSLKRWRVLTATGSDTWHLQSENPPSIGSLGREAPALRLQ